MSDDKAILLSIRPQYVSLIEEGTKTFELRRVSPKIQKGDLALVYESSPTKSLVGAFVVGDVLSANPIALWEKLGKQTGISKVEFDEYFDGCKKGCAIEICKYWSLKHPVGLSRLRAEVKINPPQSYRYLCSVQTGQILSVQ